MLKLNTKLTLHICPCFIIFYKIAIIYNTFKHFNNIIILGNIHKHFTLFLFFWFCYLDIIVFFLWFQLHIKIILVSILIIIHYYYYCYNPLFILINSSNKNWFNERQWSSWCIRNICYNNKWFKTKTKKRLQFFLGVSITGTYV